MSVLYWVFYLLKEVSHCNETHDSKQVHKIKIVSLWQIVTIPNLRINVDDDQADANENEGSVQCRPS